MTDTISRMINSSQANEYGELVARLREAGSRWQARDYRERLNAVGRIAGALAESGKELAESVFRPAATIGEIMASEVLPLAEACRYLSKRGGEILKPRSLRKRDGAWWMGSVEVTEQRDPLGVVLIIGPSNYPLFLPGVQLVQAIAAGNAVIIKPAPGCEDAMRALIKLCCAAGIPSDLIHSLESAPQTAQDTIRAGVDKVIFTGSLTTGRAVAALCTETMTPAAMELSGNDAVLVCDSADLERVASCIAYALSLNGGQTCIAPRRLFASEATLQRLLPKLRDKLKESPARHISERGLRFARELMQQALADGATIACGDNNHFQDASSVKPVILNNVQTSMSLAQEDIFAPLLSLICVSDMQEALRQASECRYALGAAIFGEPSEADRLAGSIDVGCVTINDVLVPTADPRVSFGGRRASGFGMTRGLEGLRELTQLKVVCTRRGRWLPHLSTSGDKLAAMMQGILKLRYGRTWKLRWAGLKDLLKAGRQR